MNDRPNLEEFVRQSNLIEGEGSDPRDPMFYHHLEGAKGVWQWGSRGVLLSPKAIHYKLFWDQPQYEPGRYRKVRVFVDGEEKVAPNEVGRHMRRLLAKSRKATRCKLSEQETWYLHNWFEYIHPFVDGNGRVGRLWLNNLRLLSQLPWLTVFAKDRWKYYEAIRDWEKLHAPHSFLYGGSNWGEGEGL